MTDTSDSFAASHDVDTLLHRIAERLGEKFAGTFSPETVDRYVRESYEALRQNARIHQHLPSLAEHFATDRLTALAQVSGGVGKPVPEVLFLCVHNAGRSQIAAALLDHYAGGRVHVRSAGSHPAGDVHDPVVATMREVGLDLSQAYPKPLTDDVLQAADVIVTMGCGDACPVITGKRYVDWAIVDPGGQDLEAVRSIRDDIDARVRSLLDEIAPADAGE